MNWFPQLLSRLRALFRKRELDAEMDEEMRSHIDMRTQQNIDSGMSPREARYAALRQFGGVESVKETCREQRGVRWLEHFVQDLRYAVRMLLKNPGLTAVAVLTLALGIGGTTAVFSIINGVILRPLPYPAPERLVLVWTQPSERAARKERSAYGNYLDWKEQCSAFEDLAIYDPSSCLLTAIELTEKISAARVSHNFFSILGVAPVLGRGFSLEEENQRARVAIVSYRLWQNRFGGVSNLVGRIVQIDGEPSEIIGVMPESFAFPSEKTELWELRSADQNTARGIGGWFVLGRLKRDRSLDQAQTELQSVAARLAQEYPSNRGLSARLNPLSEEIAGPNLRLAFWILFGAVISVLLIACSNLANLLLARGVVRQRELATRLALGATPLRLIRQLVIECLPLGLFGGLAGVWLAALIVRIVRAAAGTRIPRLAEVDLDPVVLCFALGLTALATVLFSIIPGTQVRRLDVNESLKEGTRGTGGLRQTSLRRALVVGEVALAFMLLFAAGLLVRSFQSVKTVDIGFNPERVLLAAVRFPQMTNRQEVVLFYKQLKERLQALPGVQAVGLIEDVFGGSNTGGRITVEGAISSTDADEVTQVRLDSITPSWFQAVGAPLLRGRLFDESEGRRSPPVAIINETMARRFWPGQEALGKRFKFGRADSTAPWLTVVGLVRDMRRDRLERPPLPQVFRPLAQVPSLHMELLVRTSSTPMALAERVRQEVQALNKSVVVYAISTLENRIGASLLERRFQMSLLAAFSLVALLLAGIGTYGVVHFSVQQRVREIGIRMAMGAQKLDVFSLIVGRGLNMVLIGVGLGITLTFGITGLMQGLLFEVKPTDPLTLAGVSFLLLGIALLASWLPARRAMHVDPIHALREQ